MPSNDTYPHWLFDDSPIDDPFGYGERAVAFLRCLKHPKSTLPKKAFQLDPWQERIVRAIYGPRHDDEMRIIKTVVLLLPRGNRKTSFSAALNLLHTIGPERRPRGEAVFAALSRSQAGLGFAEAASIIREDKRLIAATRIYDAHNSVKKIVFKKDSSFLEAISGEGAPAHGRTIAMALCDELHEWKNAELWKAIKSSLPKSQGSLLIVATTSGRGQDNIAFETVDRARKVARGEIIDPSLLPILFETDPDADWRDEVNLHRVNPGLALGYQDIEGLRQLAREAETSPTARDTFRQYHLNVWLDHSTSPFVDMATYDKGSDPIDYEALAGQPCWIGCDLSQNMDLSAVVACFHDGDTYTVLPHMFCPEVDIRKRGDLDGVNYVSWCRDGFMTATPGDAIDFATITEYIRGLCKRFDVREITFDPYLAQNVTAPLLDDGLNATTVSQGAQTQSPALSILERAIISGNFKHGGHPVLRWNFSNIAIHTNMHGNRIMHKGKSTDRIDGAAASWMAVSRAAAGDGGLSFLDDPNVTAEDMVCA